MSFGEPQPLALEQPLSSAPLLRAAASFLRGSLRRPQARGRLRVRERLVVFHLRPLIRSLSGIMFLSML